MLAVRPPGNASVTSALAGLTTVTDPSRNAMASGAVTVKSAGPTNEASAPLSSWTCVVPCACVSTAPTGRVMGAWPGAVLNSTRDACAGLAMESALAPSNKASATGVLVMVWPRSKFDARGKAGGEALIIVERDVAEIAGVRDARAE